MAALREELKIHQEALVEWYKAIRPHLVRCEYHPNPLTVEEFAVGLDVFKRREFRP